MILILIVRIPIKIFHYEYDKDYHYDLDDRVDNIWLRADGGGESVLCLGADSKVQEGVAGAALQTSTQIHQHKNSLNTQIMTIL